MEGIDVTAIVGGGGPWVLLALAVMALIRGDLVPRSTYVNQLALRDAMIRDLTAERDFYRDRDERLSGAFITYAEVMADGQTRARLQRPNLQRDRDDA